MSSKECSNCNKPYSYQRGKGGTLSLCPGCLVTIRRRKIKKLLLELKGGKCILCGYSRCVRALNFHHLDPKTKEMTFSVLMSKSMKRIEKEIKKTVLLCGNCHMEVHDGVSFIDEKDKM